MLGDEQEKIYFDLYVISENYQQLTSCSSFSWTKIEEHHAFQVYVPWWLIRPTGRFLFLFDSCSVLDLHKTANITG